MKKSNSPKLVPVTDDHILRWGGIIGGIVVVVGVMVILSTTQTGLFAYGTGAAIPGIMASTVFPAKAEVYRSAMDELNKVIEQNPSFAKNLSQLTTLMQNIPQ